MKRDRHVSAQAVPCPQCGAGVGQRCLGADGQERNVRHDVRRRMALRAEQGGPSVLGTHV